MDYTAINDYWQYQAEGDDLPTEPESNWLEVFSIALIVIGGLIGGLAFWAGSTRGAVITVGTMAVIAILISPCIGLCLLAFSIPLHGLLQLIPGMFTVSKALAILVAISFLFRLLKQDIRSYFVSRTLRWYLLVPLWAVLILPFGKFPLGGLIEVSLTIQMLGMAFLIAAIPRNFKQLRMVCLSAGLGGGFLGMYVAVFGISTLTRTGLRLAAGINENTLGHALAVSLMLTLVARQGAKRKLRIGIAIIALFTAIAIVMTGSRNTWLGLALAVLFAPILTGRISYKQKMVFFGSAVVIGIVGFSLVIRGILGEIGYYVQERLGAWFTEEATGSRLDVIWPMYLRAFLGNMVIGGGPGLSWSLPIVSHSDVIKVMSEQGLVGLFLFVGMFLAFFREALRNIDPRLRLISVFTIIYLVGAGFAHNTPQLKSFPLAIGVLACMANLGFCPKDHQLHMYSPEEIEWNELDRDALAEDVGPEQWESNEDFEG